MAKVEGKVKMPIKALSICWLAAATAELLFRVAKSWTPSAENTFKNINNEYFQFESYQYWQKFNKVKRQINIYSVAIYNVSILIISRQERKERNV